MRLSRPLPARWDARLDVGTGLPRGIGRPRGGHALGHGARRGCVRLAARVPSLPVVEAEGPRRQRDPTHARRAALRVTLTRDLQRQAKAFGQVAAVESHAEGEFYCSARRSRGGRRREPWLAVLHSELSIASASAYCVPFIKVQNKNEAGERTKKNEKTQ